MSDTGGSVQGANSVKSSQLEYAGRAVPRGGGVCKVFLKLPLKLRCAFYGDRYGISYDLQEGGVNLCTEQKLLYYNLSLIYYKCQLPLTSEYPPGAPIGTVTFTILEPLQTKWSLNM